MSHIIPSLYLNNIKVYILNYNIILFLFFNFWNILTQDNRVFIYISAFYHTLILHMLSINTFHFALMINLILQNLLKKSKFSIFKKFSFFVNFYFSTIIFAHIEGFNTVTVHIMHDQQDYLYWFRSKQN